MDLTETEVKLRFPDFIKILIIDGTHLSRAFVQLKAYIDQLISYKDYQLYWKDTDNDFINFNDIDGFTIALSLNLKKITIYVCPLEDVHDNQTCSKCRQQFSQYAYHCLGCKNIILCQLCIKSHQSDRGHFAIIEKSKFYSIHPFLYRQINLLLEKEANDKTLDNICNFFQKIALKHGLSVVEGLDLAKEDLCKGQTTLIDIISHYNKKPMDTILPGESLDNQDDADIDGALNRMLNMGFVNTDGCIRNLLVRFKGNIPKTLDWMSRSMITDQTH